jgi:hypothetical protein
MAVTRWQFRLSTYLATVVIAALVAASPRLIAWAVRTPRDYVSIEIGGKQVLFDARVWPASSFTAKRWCQIDSRGLDD